MGYVIKIPFKIFWTIVALLPSASFFFCVCWSLLKNFDETTRTHCNVQNFLPSISTAIGSYNLQRYVWQVGIALHCAPRFLVALMYYNHFRNIINEAKWINIVYLTYLFQNIEIICLISLSFVSSTENFPAHQKFFVMFVLSALVSMTLTYAILKYRMHHLLTKTEKKSVRLKLLLLSINLFAFSLSVYFYFRHNWYCESGMYTLFALSEYVVVLSNICYHFTAIYDFSNQYLIVATC
ncbi:post-GPI attachment to proteins factor 2-like [Parasteatoda tepidariorum]|uniref:post-GPI attachment to proteins factor 2-like n=1 Tax=Parasteatoda tepidariorum TaxID=114398 RepID=UPI00077FA732|nr:post-GPI attachment to proteins factor 2-like [Parasteatoda tepidariorum]XP_042906323.1 post-GPI attachment to proteins factor 2-like [Parasteatoda tepidariorum]